MEGWVAALRSSTALLVGITDQAGGYRPLGPGKVAAFLFLLIFFSYLLYVSTILSFPLW